MLSNLHWKPSVGLVISGEMTWVRQALDRYRWIPIRAVEILGAQGSEDTNLDFLTSCQNISYLKIHVPGIASYAPIAAMRFLKELRIEGIEKKAGGRNLDFSPLSSLCRLHLDGFIGEDCVFTVPSLRALGLVGYTGPNLSWLDHLPGLEELALLGGELTDVSHLRLAENLTWLSIASQRKLHDFLGLSACPSVRFVWVERCPHFSDVALLQKLAALETVRVIDCGELSNIQVLVDMPTIRHIHLHMQGARQDFKLFRACSNIESLYISAQSKAEEKYWQAKNKPYGLIRPDLRAHC